MKAYLLVFLQVFPPVSTRGGRRLRPDGGALPPGEGRGGGGLGLHHDGPWFIHRGLSVHIAPALPLVVSDLEDRSSIPTLLDTSY